MVLEVSSRTTLHLSSIHHTILTSTTHQPSPRVKTLAIALTLVAIAIRRLIPMEANLVLTRSMDNIHSARLAHLHTIVTGNSLHTISAGRTSMVIAAKIARRMDRISATIACQFVSARLTVALWDMGVTSVESPRRLTIILAMGARRVVWQTMQRWRVVE